MGFFGLDDTPPPKQKGEAQLRGVSVEAVREAGCALCPLNKAKCKSPKIKPMGSDEPLVYILGSSPTKEADAKDQPFAGELLRFIRSKIPEKYKDAVRWNNVVRTYVGEGERLESRNKDREGEEIVLPKDPEQLAIEACREYQEQDIVLRKPPAVVVMGAVPLRWIGDETHDYLWQGRRFPASLHGHKFWVYPMQHPYHVFKERRWDGHEPDSEKTWRRYFRKIFRDIEEDRIAAPAVHTEKEARRNVHWVMGEGGDDLKRIEGFLDDTCSDGGTAGLDYETSVLRPYIKDAKILSAAVANAAETLAFPFDHREAKWTSKHRRMLGDMWRDFLMDKRIIKAAHQLAFEMEWSAFFWGPEVCRAAPWEDTISQAYVINERQGMLGLENLTMQHYGINIKKLSNVNRRRMADEPLIKILPYNGIDAKYHRKLAIRQRPILRELGMEDVYAHQLARIPSLVLTQMHGIPIDQEELKRFAKPAIQAQEKALADLKALKCWSQFRTEYGEEFNPQSTPDVVKMLKLLKLGKETRNKKGRMQVKADEKTLRTLDHPFASALIKWRKPSKVLGTYVEGVKEGAEDTHIMPDKLVHPIVSTYKVETWRTSSEDPNTQNWPMRGPNVVIRKVVNKPGFKVVKFDYAGIQARNIAMESGDTKLIQSFIDWYDIHTEWAHEFAENYPKWAPKGWQDKDGPVWKELRNVSKNGFVFPSFFGAKARSITVSLNVFGRKDLRVEEVQEVQDTLFERFPRVHKWQDGLRKFYDKHGYVTGHSGFRRHAPVEFNQLINSPIQGDESIIVLSAMNALSEMDFLRWEKHKGKQSYQMRYQPMMEIHDDLTFLWPADKVDQYSEIVITEMLRIRFPWIDPVPLVVEQSVGDNWCDTKRVGDFESVTHDTWREVKKH